jgi:hypothetical protein
MKAGLAAEASPPTAPADHLDLASHHVLRQQMPPGNRESDIATNGNF